ncbi:MAG: sulfur oxidation c-type cytochrome SoxX, partial [Bradyrhizobiaceae bacterium]|nr:sulfur oxidation c-type cytochrome SoxX [Bradyrhizobiaceae bacterium]
MNRIACAALAALALSTLPVLGAEEKSAVSREQVERAVAAAWSKLPPELQARVEQDQTMRDCSQYHNDPPKPVADAILVREKATIVYPPDNQFMGDWKKGEKSALSG